jgi:hypothetical protein
MNNFALNVPINSVSYGQSSIAILREIYNRDLSPCIFPIGGVDLSAQKPDQNFELWLQSCINKSYKKHKRDSTVFKLWHLNQSLDSVSKKQGLYFFHETDSPTDEEINAVNNQDICFVSSKYTKEIFESHGSKELVYAPLGFDEWNFKKLDRPYLGKDVILFNLSGKREARKNSDLIAALWVKRFGNQRQYQLNISCFNPFFMRRDNQPMSFEEQVGMFIGQVFNGQKPWNVNFIPPLRTNAEYNDLLNAAQIDLTGLSSFEGFNLPLFQSLCLGKWAVTLAAHVHSDYADDHNSILVQPSGMRPAEDSMFFIKGHPFNQGNWFTFNPDEAISAMEKAVAKAHTPNPAGEKLKETFTVKNLVDTILNFLGKSVI